MSVYAGPEIVNDSLVLCLDAANAKSYPRSGTAWSDLSGNGNNGTLVNGPTFSSANGGSIVFDGTNDYVTIPDSASLTASSMSIEAWVRFSAVGTRIIYCGKGAGNSNLDTEYWLEKNSSDKFSVYFSIGASGGVNLQLETSPVLVNTWYHVMGVYNGSTVRGYVNGVLAPDFYNMSGSIVNTSIEYSVGRLGSLGVFYHNGNIAANRIYSRALAAAEVLQNYNALKGRFGL